MTIDVERLQELFFGALDQPREEWAAYVAEACGSDDAMRAELESLLAHHDDSQLIDEQGQSALLSALEHVDELGADRPRYRTMGELGVGGFGVVVRRFDRRLRRSVATKSPIVPDSRQDVALLREARLLAYLDHPGVVQVYDLREDETGFSYTMELLEGEPLSARIGALRAQGRHLAVSEALRIVTRVCETVANAHAKGVLHLDIKPDNVMLQPFGHVSLIDWGMARFYDPEPYRRHLASAGETELDDPSAGELRGGTPAYMAPEQRDPDATLSPAADVYGIGVLLFELLTGRPPEAHVAAAVHELRPEVSERVGAICAQMLAPSPEARPPSAEAVLEELAELSDVGGSAERVRLDPGEVLFEEGADSTTAYQILAGELEIVIAGETVATRRAGEIVGELAMLSRTKRSATVRAKSGAVLRAIDWGALEAELSKVDPLVAHLLRALSDKLVQTTRG